MRELKLDEMLEVYGGAGDQVAETFASTAVPDWSQANPERLPWQLPGPQSSDVRWF